MMSFLPLFWLRTFCSSATLASCSFSSSIMWYRARPVPAVMWSMTTPFKISSTVNIKSYLPGLGVCQTQQRHDKGHPHINAVLRLLKIGGAGVVVHVQRDLVDAGQGVQHRHVGGGQRQLFPG